MSRRRSVPGAQSSLDPRAQTRPCSTCRGKGRARKPPRVRLDISLTEARDRAAVDRRLAEAVRRAEGKVDEQPYELCPTCGGQKVVTILAL